MYTKYGSGGGQTTLSFYVKRWLSLIKSFLPAYIFVFIGYWIIRGNPFAKVYSSNPLRMLLDVVGIADLFQSPMIIAVWWYMSLAQMIILVIPLLYKLVQNFGFGSYILVYMLLQFLPDGVKSNYGGKYLNYLLVAVLAVCMENASIWESLLKKRGRLYKSILEFVLLFALIVGLIFVKVKIQSVDSWQIGGFVSGVATLLIVILVTKYLSPKPIDLVLRFLGGHSGNIFMIHAFLYGPCKFIVFWSHNAIISYFTLLILSVCVSVILEFIKKVTRYNALFNTVSKKITNKINI